MPIISDFPTERDWGIVIDAIKTAIMSGAVTSSMEARSGETVCTNSGMEIIAVKKI